MKNGHNEIAKHLMLRRVVTAQPHETPKEVIKRFALKKPIYDNFDYVNVIDAKGHLLGIVSAKELVNANTEIKLSKIMKTNFTSVRPSTDQEKVANIAIKYGIKAVPVVDKEGILLGVVPPREIFKVLQWEYTEDVLRSSGITGKVKDLKKAVEKGPIRMSFFRLPSLLVGVLGGLLATSIMQHFQASLESQLVLAFFVPIMLYLSAAVGTQTGTIFVRKIATENVKYASYAMKEIFTGIIIAMIIGGILFSVVLLWHQSFLIAFTIGLSLIIAIVTATILGIAVPLGLMAIKRDPAISGGPLINVMQDIITLVTYFTVASIVLL
ncbi:magnesium transporter [Pseudomonadota bacterium]